MDPETVRTIASLITIVSIFAGVVAWLNRKFGGIDRRFDRLQFFVAEIHRETLISTKLLSSVTGALAEAGTVSRQALAAMVAESTQAEPVMEIVRRHFSGNPLSPDEGRRLKQYVDMVRDQKTFTPEQAIDFNRIVNKLEKEEPPGEGMAWLGVIAAFILGYYLGEKSEKKDSEGSKQ